MVIMIMSNSTNYFIVPQAPSCRVKHVSWLLKGIKRYKLTTNKPQLNHYNNDIDHAY